MAAESGNISDIGTGNKRAVKEFQRASTAETWGSRGDKDNEGHEES
jgi:hypothetical protein